MALYDRRKRLATDAPEGYQRSRSAEREIYGTRSIDGSAPLSPRSPTGMTIAPAANGTGSDPESWRRFFERPAPLGNSPALVGASKEWTNPIKAWGPTNTDPSQVFRMAGAPPIGGPSTGLVGATNPGATGGTPSRIQGPNISAAQGMREGWSRGRLAFEAARALGENRAAVAPGGMGTYSYTQAAQASSPMVPFRGGRPQVTRPTTPIAMQYYQEGLKSVFGGPVPAGFNFTSQYGSGSVRSAEDVSIEKMGKMDAGISALGFNPDTPMNDFSKPDKGVQGFLKRYRR